MSLQLGVTERSSEVFAFCGVAGNFRSMQVYKEARGLIICLSRGERIVEMLTHAAREQGVKGASIGGIGALSKVELGYYIVFEKRYERTLLDDDHELLSLVGNVSLKDGVPFVHVHANLGGRDFRSVGGHLFEATVGASAEIRMERWSTAPVRMPDAAVGLSVWNGCEW